MRYIAAIASLSLAATFSCGGPVPEEPAAEPAADYCLVYFGTGGGDAKGIYVSEVDPATDQVSEAKLAATLAGAGFVEIHPSRSWLFSTARDREVEEPWHGVDGYSIDHANGLLTEFSRASCVGHGPAHVNISPAGSAVSVAN